MLSLTGSTDNGLITLDGAAPNGTVESNLTFDGESLSIKNTTIGYGISVKNNVIKRGNFNAVYGTWADLYTLPADSAYAAYVDYWIFTENQSGTPTYTSGKSGMLILGWDYETGAINMQDYSSGDVISVSGYSSDFVFRAVISGTDVLIQMQVYDNLSEYFTVMINARIITTSV
jgi:hypothetical protein